MSSRRVSWKIGDDGVLDVLVDEAERHNPFSKAVIDGLKSAFQLARTSDDVRCVLVRTAGEKVFMAGADLDSVNDIEFVRMDLFGLFEMMENLEVPVVVAVQGLALGGGFEFTICSDLVVAAEEAQFGLPETGIGLAPGIAMIRLHQEIGRHLAKELAFTSRRLIAEEASRLHLVNKVVPRGRLIQEAKTMAAEVAARAPISVGVTKKAFNREWGAADWAFVRESMDAVLRSRDCSEGIAAFKEKRPPRFTGE